MSKITVKFYISHPEPDVVKANRNDLVDKLWRMKFADDSIYTGMGNLRIQDIRVFNEDDSVTLTGAWTYLFQGLNYAPMLDIFTRLNQCVSLIKVYVQRDKDGFTPELTVRWSNDDAAYCKQCAMSSFFAEGVQHGIDLLEGKNYDQQKRENVLDIAFQKPEYATITYNKLGTDND